VRVLSGLAIAMVFFAVPSLAAEQSQPQADPRDEIVCKNMSRGTGSRLGQQKECHTRREWQERQAEDREMIERAQMTDRRNGS
jgi:hypothetical protein